MTFRFRSVPLTKRYPLAISRGVSTGSVNLYVEVEHDGNVGIGEGAPGLGWDDTLADLAEPALTALLESLETPDGEPPSPFDAWQAGREQSVPPPAMAALDIALWDLVAKRAGQPLHRVLGLPRRATPTSVTIGLNPVEVIRERVPEILERTGARFLKVKLGSPGGPDHDQESFAAAREAAEPFGVELRVDANGGWSLETARRMLAWLAQRGCEYVEQPLAEGQEAELPMLFEGRPLPIFIDESCRFASDVPKWAGAVDGVNLKLMKCGGITEAMRIVAVARAHRLETMIGCMGESSVAIAAGASIGALFDHIDLDSHLNLAPDPASGTEWFDGAVLPADRPGHGAALV